MNEYAVYRADDFLCMGTAPEIAEFMGWKVNTVYWYSTPQYKKRILKRTNARKYITVTKLEEEK